MRTEFGSDQQEEVWSWETSALQAGWGSDTTEAPSEPAAARILSVALLHGSAENTPGLGCHTDLPCHKRLS